MGPTSIGAEDSTLWKRVEFASSILTTLLGAFLTVCCDLSDLTRVASTNRLRPLALAADEPVSNDSANECPNPTRLSVREGSS